MIPNIFSLLGESIVGKHIAKGIIFSNSPKKFHPNGSRIQDIFNTFLWQVFFELYILQFPCKNFFYGHDPPPFFIQNLVVDKPIDNASIFYWLYFHRIYKQMNLSLPFWQSTSINQPNLVIHNIFG